MAGLCVLTFATGQPAGAFAIAFVVGIGWAMAHRHRRMPLHDTLDGIYAGMEQMNGQLATMAPEPQPERPRFTVHQGGRE